MLESVSGATDLDLISYLQAIPDARMRRGVRIPAWYLLLVAVLGILSRCQSLRDLERFAIRHHSVLTAALGLELRRPPSDSAFRYFGTPEKENCGLLECGQRPGRTGSSKTRSRSDKRFSCLKQANVPEDHPGGV